MPEQTLSGIVLKREDAGDHDRRLTVLTRETGKTTIFAKGAKRAGSRLAGVSEPLTFARFHVSSGRRRLFLVQAQSATTHPHLRTSYDRLVCGLAMAELACESLPYESPDEGIFELLALALDQLSEHDKPHIVLIWFCARLLEIEGRMPDWKSCATSGEPVVGSEVWVSTSAGGAVSTDHVHSSYDRFLASGECLIGIEKIAALGLPPRSLKRARECLWVLVQFCKSGIGARLPALESCMDGFAQV